MEEEKTVAGHSGERDTGREERSEDREMQGSGANNGELGESGQESGEGGLPDDPVVSGQQGDPERDLPPVPAPVGETDDLNSQIVSDVFVQQLNRFRKRDRAGYEEALANRMRGTMEMTGTHLESGEEGVGAMSMAIGLQKIFHTVAHFLQGLLAGVTLCHTISVLFFSSQHFLDFLQRFAPLALPTQSSYYVAYVICAVACLDRYDIEHSVRGALIEAVTLQTGVVAALFYLIAVSLSVLATPFDERLHLSTTDPSQLSFYYLPAAADQQRQQIRQEQPWLSGEFNVWKWACVGRSLCTLAAWVLIAARPNTDNLLRHISQSDKQQVEPPKKNKKTKKGSIGVQRSE